jgi:hypothetical protein
MDSVKNFFLREIYLLMNFIFLIITSAAHNSRAQYDCPAEFKLMLTFISYYLTKENPIFSAHVQQKYPSQYVQSDNGLSVFWYQYHKIGNCQVL